MCIQAFTFLEILSFLVKTLRFLRISTPLTSGSNSESASTPLKMSLVEVLTDTLLSILPPSGFVSASELPPPPPPPPPAAAAAELDAYEKYSLNYEQVDIFTINI